MIQRRNFKTSKVQSIQLIYNENEIENKTVK
jgi:hypothetical protein